jgi:transposase-like protein
MGLEGKPAGRFFELDEIARAGARRMLIEALKAEAADYLERHRDERESEARAQSPARRTRPTPVLDQSNPNALHAAFAQGDRGALPILYPRGLSTGDFRREL